MPQHLFVLGDPHEQHQSAQSGENPARVRIFSHGHVQTLPSSFVVQQGASYSSAQAMQRAKMMHNPEYVEALWQATYEPPRKRFRTEICIFKASLAAMRYFLPMEMLYSARTPLSRANST